MRKQKFLTTFFLFPIALLVGCGGGGSGTATNSVTVNSRSASLVITVKWPKPTRLVPIATASIKINITYQGNGSAVTSATIPQGQTTTTLNQLPAANLLMTATALDSNGVELAKGSMKVTTQVNQMATPVISLGTSIDHLVVAPANPMLTVGGTLQLQASGVNTAGEMVLLTPSTLTWAVSDQTVASVDAAQGILIGKQTGTTTVTVTDTETLTATTPAKTGTATVTVSSIVVNGLQLDEANGVNFPAGDNVTVSGSGTTGIYQGNPINNTVNTYSVAYDTAAYLSNGATLTLESGGTLANIASYGTNFTVELINSKFTMTGGTVLGYSAGISADANSNVTISGGTITADTTLYSSGSEGSAFFSGGTGSIINISGGTFNGAFGVAIAGSDTAIISGGEIFGSDVGIFCADGGNVTISGGAISGKLSCENGGVMDIMGTSFTDGAGHPLVSPITSGSGTIKGTLKSGEAINTTYSVSGGTIKFN